MKIIIGIVVAVVIVLGGGLAVLGPTIKKSMSSMGGNRVGTLVRMEVVEERELIETILARGEIEPHTKVDISAQVVSEIVALPFREEDVVKKGDVVIRLDDRDLKARLASSQASAEISKASLVSTKASHARTKAQLDEQLERRKGLLNSLDFAERNLKRKQELYDTDDIPLSELDIAAERVQDIRIQIKASDTVISGAESSLAAADAQIVQAEASVKQAEAQIELANEGLRNTVILSPIDGKVVKLNGEVGETVVTGTMNSPGTVIMTIADLSRMKMIARVDESDIAPIKAGQTARVHINSYKDEVFEGVVDRIALQLTPEGGGTGFFETEIMLRLDGREIRSGGHANAYIEITKHVGLAVPSQSVVDRDIDELPQEVVADNTVINFKKRVIGVAYCVRNGKTVATPVKTGASDETHTLILDGLKAGDVVVTGPYKELDKLKHEQAVRDITKTDKDGNDIVVDKSETTDATENTDTPDSDKKDGE